MADNSFRTYRRDAAPQGGQQADDPLAELARLIGQGEPVHGAQVHGAPVHDAPVNDAGHVPRGYEQPSSAADAQWANDPRYALQPQARQSAPQAQQDTQYDAQYDPQYDAPQAQYDPRAAYDPNQYDERAQYDAGQQNDPRQGYDQSGYDPRQPADQYPPYRAAPPSYAEYDQPAADPYAPPAPPYGNDPRGYEPRHDDAHDSIQELPAFLPRGRDDRYGYAADGEGDDAQHQQGEDDEQAYALEDYEGEEEEAPPRKRRAVALISALLGLAVLGTAGAFGYRAMFGGSMLPSLPPIIKADNSPNKIVPADSANAQAAGNGASAPDKLVSREERPVDVPAPGNAPRVVSTIPVPAPTPNSGLQSSMAAAFPGANMNAQNISGAAPAGPGAAGGPLALGPTAAAPVYGGPTPGVPSSDNIGVSMPMAGSSNAKKIHTVAIHTGQDSTQDSADAAQAAASATAPVAAPVAAPPSRAPSHPARPVAAAPQAAAPQGSNAPLSIVPSQADTAPTPRTRTAMTHPAADAAPAPSAGGGYSVQVSSQRSEAEAQAAYHGLQAKYPAQLGGHTPSVRQVNLGDKGVYYRTLVGPFASMEQAAQMCSSLKAAGGSCIVQRN